MSLPGDIGGEKNYNAKKQQYNLLQSINSLPSIPGPSVRGRHRPLSFSGRLTTEVVHPLKMKIRCIDGERYRNAFLAGTAALERRREHLNSINVFPVPDGDTGDNMVFTCRSIAEGTRVSRSLAETASSMAEAAFSGARGNSGIIFCQYIHGLARAFGPYPRVDAPAFAESLLSAVPFAEEALHRPVEGTILTVMREWSHAVRRISETETDFAVLLPLSLEDARKSLRETPARMDLLAREKVVDAGAQSFVDFLEGVVEFLRRGSLRHFSLRSATAAPAGSHEHSHGDEMPSFRYCTEAVLHGEGLSRPGLIGGLSRYGDSIVVGGGGGRFRVHVHTDRPAEVMDRLSGMGRVSFQKVDDMKRQVEARNSPLSTVGLLTDSCCDLPQELLDRYQVHTVPLTVSSGGWEYLDKLTLKPGEIYTALRETGRTFTTSQPAFGEFVKRYSFLKSCYDSVISLHLSSALSGTWSVSRKAADHAGGEGIHVLDSKNLSGALGLLVLKAAEAAAAGKSCPEILEILRSAIPRTRIFAGLNSLRYLVRGGRAGAMAGFVGTMLNLFPMITVDPEGKACGFGRPGSERSNRKKMLDEFKRLTDRHGLWKYSVLHADAPGAAEELAADLEEACGRAPEYTMEISPVVGINTGPGSAGFALILED